MHYSFKILGGDVLLTVFKLHGADSETHDFIVNVKAGRQESLYTLTFVKENVGRDYVTQSLVLGGLADKRKESERYLDAAR